MVSQQQHHRGGRSTIDINMLILNTTVIKTNRGTTNRPDTYSNGSNEVSRTYYDYLYAKCGLKGIVHRLQSKCALVTIRNNLTKVTQVKDMFG